MMTLKCSALIIEQTLSLLRRSAENSVERVVLWLGHDRPNALEVAEVFEPDQVTAIDYFEIPAESMRTLMFHLRRSRMKIIAQLHTHPKEAFHSRADDKWAIIRHSGALSLVLPRFASGTQVSNFLEQVKTYELSSENRWLLIDNERIEIVT